MSADVDTLRADGDVNDDPTPEDLNGGVSDDDGDLFGDDEDDQDLAPTTEFVRSHNFRILLPLSLTVQCRLNRTLDDSELDSGDDQGRTDRLEPTVEDPYEDQTLYEERKLRLMDIDMARINALHTQELYSLSVPPFLGVKHKAFDPTTYTPPTQPHDFQDGDPEPPSKFSAFSTASTTMFWRRDPKNPQLVQSNTRLVRWSDGSLTLQMASQPKEQYRISTNPLRQGWPKPQKSLGQKEDYDPTKDTHNYLAGPHACGGIDLQIMAPFDATMKIQPTGDYVDESVLKLQQSLAAATQQHDPLAALKQVREDPELARKAAEMFEKDRIRTARKREAAEERAFARKTGVLGRMGLGGRSGGAGLSVAGLEDDDGYARPKGRRPGTKIKRRNRTGDIYSDDEDEDTHRGRGADEYDREDDFLAASDEEPEIYEDDEEVEAEDDDPDVDDLEIDGREAVVDSRTRGKQGRRDPDRGGSPKRAASEDDEDGGVGVPRQKKRRVVDDDDEDE